MINISWSSIKSFSSERKASIQYIELDSSYIIWCFDGPMYVTCEVVKDTDDCADFEGNYKNSANVTPKNDVTTAYEKSDKTLRCVCAFAETDTNGVVEFCIPVPSTSRWIAYGDIEFKNREFGDYVSTIELTDLDRLLAMQVALGIDPNATQPVDDATAAAALGMPLYPVLGHYDERGMPDPLPTNAKGNPRGGISMSFQYSITEAEPIGGYGQMLGGMYLRILAKKKTASAGQECQLSIDWGEPNA
jgi:hypothetical protein